MLIGAMGVRVIICKGHKRGKQTWFVKRKVWFPTRRYGDIMQKESGANQFPTKREAEAAARRWKCDETASDLIRCVAGIVTY